jgi:hypothetical protein
VAGWSTTARPTGSLEHVEAFLGVAGPPMESDEDPERYAAAGVPVLPESAILCPVCGRRVGYCDCASDQDVVPLDT